MANKESFLPTTGSLAMTDKVRVVQQTMSRNITFLDFINSIPPQNNSAATITTIDDDYFVDDETLAVLLVDTTDKAIEIRLPNADLFYFPDEMISKVITIKKIAGPNDVTIIPQALNTIDGDLTAILRGDNYPYIQLISTGDTWWLYGA